jgi:alpha-L-fucosidase
MGVPEEHIIVKNLKVDEQNKIKKIELIGSNEKIQWSQHADYLEIKKPITIPNPIAVVFKVYQK